MKGSANEEKGEKQLHFLSHILGPMQFHIAVYIDGELNKLFDFNLLPLLMSESWKRKLLHLALFNPHSVVLGHTTALKPERNQ